MKKIVFLNVMLVLFGAFFFFSGISSLMDAADSSTEVDWSHDGQGHLLPHHSQHYWDSVAPVHMSAAWHAANHGKQFDRNDWDEVSTWDSCHNR